MYPNCYHVYNEFSAQQIRVLKKEKKKRQRKETRKKGPDGSFTLCLDSMKMRGKK